MFVIHVGQYNKTDDPYEAPRGGYVFSKTRLTQDIQKAKRFETEEMAMDFEVFVEDEMSSSVIEF